MVDQTSRRTTDLPPFGTGSIVTPKPDHWRYGEYAGRLLLVLLSDRGGRWSTGLYRHSGDPARMATVPLDLSGWELVRAVPPTAIDQPLEASDE